MEHIKNTIGININRYMLFFFMLAIFCMKTLAQQYSGSIVDAETHEVLPFATIYIDPEHKTIANANGEFSIETSSVMGNAQISYVEYQEQTIPISKLK